jgi:thiol-disulfide isomerase/thioredoxin
MKTILIISLLVVAAISASATDNPAQLLKSMQNSFDRHSSVSYKSTVKYKSLSKDDTVSFTSNVSMLREKSDTLFGGEILYTTDNAGENGTLRFYDLLNVYTSESGAKSATKYFPHKGQDWALTPTISYYALYMDFLHTKDVSIPDKMKAKMLSDTVIDGAECSSMLISGTTTAGEIETRFYVSKKLLFPVLIKNTVSVDDINSLKEIKFSSIVFDKLTSKDFSPKVLLKDYEIKDYAEKADDGNSPKLLTEGDKAPVITGRNFQKNLSDETLDFSGKVTLLDFWYMNCPWCVKAFPEVEKLLKKFSPAEFQIVGINSRDNNDKGIARLPKFLKRITMQYETILVAKELPDKYHISGWPTFYLIDQNGNVAGTYIGYEDNMEELLSGMIRKLLKK